jgi:hypothetical protein
MSLKYKKNVYRWKLFSAETFFETLDLWLLFLYHNTILNKIAKAKIEIYWKLFLVSYQRKVLKFAEILS